MKRAKQKKTEEQLSLEMVIKIREICPKGEGDYGGKEEAEYSHSNVQRLRTTQFTLTQRHIQLMLTSTSISTKSTTINCTPFDVQVATEVVARFPRVQTPKNLLAQFAKTDISDRCAVQLWLKATVADEHQNTQICRHNQTLHTLLIIRFRCRATDVLQHTEPTLHLSI